MRPVRGHRETAHGARTTAIRSSRQAAGVARFDALRITGEQAGRRAGEQASRRAGKKSPPRVTPAGLSMLRGECYAASNSRGAFDILL